ncbi:MAG TPA: ABC transporter permease [Solirubrobacterales bacterium]|nr:ABC transporter permease [Solirubrobacterales bacterium]
MTLWQGLRIGGRAVLVNKLRSGLTMLGVIIGVAAVIATIAVGAGAHARVSEQIRSLGSNLIVVRSGSLTASGVRLGGGSRRTISEDDAIAIEREVALVQAAAALVRGTEQVMYAGENWATLVQGVTPPYLDVRDWSLRAGRPITWDDVDGAARIALLGQTTVQQLFGSTDPTGQIVRIRQVPFVVIGYLERKGQSTGGQDQDDVVLIPISTAKKKVLGVSRSSPRSVETIAVKVRPGQPMRDAEAEIRALLRQRHRLRPGQEDDFFLRSLEDALRAEEASARVMTYLLAAIASVSLLVGGIGIMNIMLVSVTERTREIGLRMAVGARRSDILRQFLVEAVLLSLTGGVIGVGVGVASASVISYLAEWRTLVAPGAIVLAFGFAAAIGVFFGFYPARKAARLDPIEALRYE